MKTDLHSCFLELVKAGLWEKEVQLLPHAKIDICRILNLAIEQSVVGLVTAGLERVEVLKEQKGCFIKFVGITLQIEQRNREIDDFIAKLTKRLQRENVFSLLVKGQGVAQCYERPLWRAAGDVDLLLDVENYGKAKEILLPIAYDIQKEDVQTLHQAMKIMGVDLELHGKMPFSISGRVDKVIDQVIAESLINGKASVWKVNEIDVLIPNPDNHLFLVFTHFLHHFFIEGVGLRQICDWCRILWAYRSELNLSLLESRIKEAGLMSEWKVFGAMAVAHLGMPAEAMPFYDSQYKRKGDVVLKRILKSGNFGHNKDLSYRTRYSGTLYKIVSLWRRFWDFVSFTPIFPIDAPKFFVTYVSKKSNF